MATNLATSQFCHLLSLPSYYSKVLILLVPGGGVGTTQAM